MNIGIIGTGLIGETLARQLARAGHQVMISFSKTPGKLVAIETEIGINITIGTPKEALNFGEITILSVHFTVLDIVIEQMGEIAGKIVIDTSNQYDIDLPKGISAASEVLSRLPGVKLVKAFNTLHYKDLLVKGFHDPLYIIPYATDAPIAIELTTSIISSIGFFPFFTGSLSNVSVQEMHGPLFGKILTVNQAKNLITPT